MQTICTYMTDAQLFTVVLLPGGAEKYPAVIYRTPYVDAEEMMTEAEIIETRAAEFAPFLNAGYAVVYQHCRGRGKSGGDCIPYIFEREDTLALYDWIRAQAFYNGELFLFGRSYSSSVHLVAAPFAQDIKGAVLEVQDSERYNCNYRNGFYKMGLHGGWYVNMYKKKSNLRKSFVPDCYKMLPLKDFSHTVLGERAADFDEILRHPDPNDAFWRTRFGGGEAHDAVKHARIPVLLVTGFYDIYTGGVFDMWNGMDETALRLCALAVSPYDHSGKPDKQPVRFENGALHEQFDNYRVRWLDAARGRGAPPFEKGKITYYKVFGDAWCCDDFSGAADRRVFSLGAESVTYTYNPYAPAAFPGGLSANFGGNAWQDAPGARYDVITVYTPVFEKDTYIKGRMRARLAVCSDAEDTCFYMRVSLCKKAGDYGLRDDINQISNFTADYRPGSDIMMDFSFDEHAFVVHAGEKLRIDISSSAFPHYVPHTNQKGLFSEQAVAVAAQNTVHLAQSWIELPVAE